MENIIIFYLNRVAGLIILGLLSLPVACASMQNHQKIYNNLKRYHDATDYEICASSGLKIIKEQEKNFLNAKNHTLLADVYEITSDCFNMTGRQEKAIEVLDTLMSSFAKKLAIEDVARLKLKTGNIWKRSGRYSKALSIFKKVEDEYADIFPERFARYARENYDEILSKKVAVISGHVSINTGKKKSGILVFVFNGFEESETVSSADGSFALPLFSSTPGTHLVVAVHQKGYKPWIKTLKYDGTLKIVIGEIELEEVKNDGYSMVVGVVCTPVRGGKRRPSHGIARFNKKTLFFKKITENSQENSDKTSNVIAVSSDDNGIYLIRLTPGLYTIKNQKEKRKIALTQGEIKMINIIGKKILKD